MDSPWSFRRQLISKTLLVMLHLPNCKEFGSMGNSKIRILEQLMEY